MASIRKRQAKGKVRWQVRWFNGGSRGSPEVSETFDKYADAVSFKGLVDSAGQRYPEGWIPGYGFVQPVTGKVTLGEWFDRAMASRTTAVPRTVEEYRSMFESRVPSWLAQKALGEITREDAGRWLNELRLARSERTGAPLSAQSIRKTHNLVSSVVKAAVVDGLVQRNPFVGLANGLGRGDEMVYLTPEQFTLLHGAMTELHRDFIEFDFWTGLRFSEITALEPSKVDLERQLLRVDQAWKQLPGRKSVYLGKPKTESGIRTIAISDRLCELLEPRMGNKLLFENGKGERIRQDSFSSSWQRALRDSGLRARFHDLRHSHAAYLISNNVPLLAVSRRLGHSSIAITDRYYGHLLPEVDDGIRRLL